MYQNMREHVNKKKVASISSFNNHQILHSYKLTSITQKKACNICRS